MARYAKQGFQTGDLSPVIKAVGRGDRIDLGKRSSADYDLKADLLNARVKGHAKTDSLERHCKEEGKHTAYCYDSFHGA